MIRMFPRRRSQIGVAAGVDQVLFGLALPSESRLNGMTAEVHVVGQDVEPWQEAHFYGIEGYILPVLDPDSGAGLNLVWDTLVPKDTDNDTIDLDTGGTDTDSMFEPGESSMEEVFDVGLKPERIYNRQVMNSWATAKFRQEDTSVLEWAVADVHKIKITKNYAVSEPSVVIFGIGNADLLDTTVSAPTILAENEWPRVKYIETVLDQALMKFLGLIEAGAETPWEEAAALLRKFLEPDVYEENGGAFGSGTLRCFSNVTFDVSVQGRVGKLQLGTGG